MNTEGRGANKMTTASVCWLPLFVIKILSGHSVTKSLSGILGRNEKVFFFFDKDNMTIKQSNWYVRKKT